MCFRKVSVREMGGQQGARGLLQKLRGGCRIDPSSGPLSLGYFICEIGYSQPYGERIHEFEVLFNSQIEDLDSEI